MRPHDYQWVRSAAIKAIIVVMIIDLPNKKREKSIATLCRAQDQAWIGALATLIVSLSADSFFTQQVTNHVIPRPDFEQSQVQ